MPLGLPDAEVCLLPGFLTDQEADALLFTLRDSVAWRQDKIRVYGKEHPLPRLQQWFGDFGCTYTWSGIEMRPEPWTPALQRVKTRVEEVTGDVFNTVLLNRYRNGQDTVSWHADNERALGPNPVIASVSLGAERDFALRHKSRKDMAPVVVRLPHGSLLVMKGITQTYWDHALPRRKGLWVERINLTFRRIINP